MTNIAYYLRLRSTLGNREDVACVIKISTLSHSRFPPLHNVGEGDHDIITVYGR